MQATAKALRVLIVEDDALVGLTLAEVLKDEGHRIIGPVGASSEAVQVMDQSRPEVAILDLTLTDGFCGGLAEDLRARDIPFMVFSGRERDQTTPDVLHQVPWLLKPGSVDEITGALSCLAGLRKPGRAWERRAQ